MRHWRVVVSIWLLLSLLVDGDPLAATVDAQPTPDPFFANAFDAALQGTRPARRSRVVRDDVARSRGAEQGESTDPGRFDIEPEVVEDEIKRTVLALRQPSVAEAKQQTYLQYLATLFGVAGAGAKANRWSDQGTMIADDLARIVDMNPLQATDRARVVGQLSDLLRGIRWERHVDVGQLGEWRERVDRVILMRRLDASQRRVASSDTLTDQAEHELGVMELMSQLLLLPSLPDSRDDDYRGHCRAIIDAARHVRRGSAGELKLRDAARTIRQACDDCHANYRG